MMEEIDMVSSVMVLGLLVRYLGGFVGWWFVCLFYLFIYLKSKDMVKEYNFAS